MDVRTMQMMFILIGISIYITMMANKVSPTLTAVITTSFILSTTIISIYMY